VDSEEIRVELYKRRKEHSQAKIADRLGVSRTAVMLTIDKKIVSKKIMQEIADALEKDKEYVFPEHFLKKAS